jgi:hypothetical protein
MKIITCIQILTTVKEWEKSRRSHLIEAKKQIEKGAYEVRVIGAGHTLAFIPSLEIAKQMIKEDEKTTQSANSVLGAIAAGITDAPRKEAPKDSTNY